MKRLIAFAAAMLCARAARAQSCTPNPFGPALPPSAIQKQRRNASLGNTRSDAEQRKRLARIDAQIAASQKCYAGFNRLKIGMTGGEAVQLACKPESVNPTVTPRGTREQWVYGPGDYVYFEDRRVVAIQRHRE